MVAQVLNLSGSHWMRLTLQVFYPPPMDRIANQPGACELLHVIIFPAHGKNRPCLIISLTFEARLITRADKVLLNK